MSSSYADGGGSVCEYEYDEQGRLVKCVETFLSAPGFVETEYTYDSAGILIKTEETTTYTWGDVPTVEVVTYSFTYDDQGRVSTKTSDSYSYLYNYDFPLLTIEERSHRSQFDGRIITESTAYFQDVMGSTIWSIAFTDAKITSDNEGYIVNAVADLYSGPVTYQFFYDGETPKDIDGGFDSSSGSGEPDDNDTSDVLSYPISEEACYIIYKNFFGSEMSEYERIEINRYGEGAAEYIAFDLYGKIEIMPGIPNYCFYVYVNTGKCEAGTPVGGWYEFQAEDYYS